VKLLAYRLFDPIVMTLLIPKEKSNNNLKQYYQVYHESEKAG